jgi:hypothetical protein
MPGCRMHFQEKAPPKRGNVRCPKNGDIKAYPFLKIIGGAPRSAWGFGGWGRQSQGSAEATHSTTPRSITTRFKLGHCDFPN